MRIKEPQKEITNNWLSKPCRRQMFYQSACWLYSELLKLPFYSRYKKSLPAYGFLTLPHSMAYNWNPITGSKFKRSHINLTTCCIQIGTDLQRTRTCTLTPLSLSFLVLEFESPDRCSRTNLSIERGVCDGDKDTNPPLLCVESIAFYFAVWVWNLSQIGKIQSRSESMTVLLNSP